MVKRSKGKVSKHSRLLRRRVRTSYGMTKLVRTFQEGAKVVIAPKSTFGGAGMPHPRYRGRLGTVIGRQGSAYVVEIRDGRMTKRLTVTPVHLE